MEAYRAHRLAEHQLATILGMSRYDLDGFLLKDRGVWLEYGIEGYLRERELGDQLRQKRLAGE